MNVDDAVALLRDAVPTGTGVWADLGAGTGTFTRALVKRLATDSTVYAVDADAKAIRALRQLSATSGSRIVPIHADFTQSLELPSLDGILLANSLHFVRDQLDVLIRVTSFFRDSASFHALKKKIFPRLMKQRPPGSPIPRGKRASAGHPPRGRRPSLREPTRSGAPT